MDPHEVDHDSKRKSALLIGQISGFAAGLVIAMVLGTDSRMTAFSGMVLGAAAGFSLQVHYSSWIRMGFAAISILSVSYVWWPS